MFSTLFSTLFSTRKGFDQQVWTASEIDTANTAGIEFKYLSNNGEEHYPGNLQVAQTCMGHKIAQCSDLHLMRQ